MEKLKKYKSIKTAVTNFKKSKVPFHIWLVAYFVGLKKELIRTRWIKGKDFGKLILKVFVVIFLLSGILFSINYFIVFIFGQIGLF